MITDLKTLISLCEDELNSREYTASLHNKIKAEWENLNNWMKLNNYIDFSESIGFQYCDEILGTHIIVDRLTRSEQIRLRAVRMLTSYQKDGDFEFRTPRIERIFYGSIGNQMCLYLTFLRNVQHLSENTIRNKEQYLYEFFCYLEKISEIIKEYKIARSTVHKWKKNFSNSGSFKAKDNRTEQEKELIKLRKENQKLKMENDILKQAALILGQK